MTGLELGSEAAGLEAHLPPVMEAGPTLRATTSVPPLVREESSQEQLPLPVVMGKERMQKELAMVTGGECSQEQLPLPVVPNRQRPPGCHRSFELREQDPGC